MIVDLTKRKKRDIVPLAGMNNNFGTHFTWVYQCQCGSYNSLPHHRWGCDSFECYSCSRVNLIENESQFNVHHCIKGHKATNNIMDFAYECSVIVEKHGDVKARHEKWMDQREKAGLKLPLQEQNQIS
jgi:hypothetical protein